MPSDGRHGVRPESVHRAGGDLQTLPCRHPGPEQAAVCAPACPDCLCWVALSSLPLCVVDEDAF